MQGCYQLRGIKKMSMASIAKAASDEWTTSQIRIRWVQTKQREENLSSDGNKNEEEQQPLPLPDYLLNRQIFINTAPEDRQLAEQIEKRLENSKASVTLPLAGESVAPSERFADLEENLTHCDVIFLLYHAAPPNWMQEQLRLCRKNMAQRETPYDLIVVLAHPDNPPIETKFSNLYRLDCEPSAKACITALRELKPKQSVHG
ncbi:MAG: TIR domain-containing protein [Gammaproteobacteria bacterium]|nr:TIR domain-containing protein [Gammaproteobacteria bacterium]